MLLCYEASLYLGAAGKHFISLSATVLSKEILFESTSGETKPPVWAGRGETVQPEQMLGGGFTTSMAVSNASVSNVYAISKVREP